MPKNTTTIVCVCLCGSVATSNGLVLEDLERHLIVSALQQADNNKSKAARLLGLTRDTLRYRLEKYNLN